MRNLLSDYLAENSGIDKYNVACIILFVKGTVTDVFYYQYYDIYPNRKMGDLIAESHKFWETKSFLLNQKF